MLSSRDFTRIVLGCALLPALLFGGCDRQSARNTQPAAAAPGANAGDAGMLDRSHHGEALPAIVLKDPAGKELRVAGLAGHPVLVNLWATWCAACVVELPTLDRLAASGVRVVTVSEDTGNAAQVGEFLAKHGVARLPAWLDPDGALSTQYRVGNLPTTILYDATGHEIWRYTGGNDWMGAKAKALLTEGSR